MHILISSTGDVRSGQRRCIVSRSWTPKQPNGQNFRQTQETRAQLRMGGNDPTVVWVKASIRDIIARLGLRPPTQSELGV